MSFSEVKPSRLRRLPPSAAKARRSVALDVLPTEDAAAAAVAPAPTALAALLTTHVLRDGELVLLILKPSFWFILFQSLGFAAAVAAAALAAALLDGRSQHQHAVYLSVALFLVAGRVMWSVLQWMGRLYILTDLRILRLSGVFTVDIFDCPLRKVARTRLTLPIRERLLGLGSIEIIPRDDTLPFAIWQTVAKPRQVHEKIQAAVKKAKQSGFGCE